MSDSLSRIGWGARNVNRGVGHRRRYLHTWMLASAGRLGAMLLCCALASCSREASTVETGTSAAPQSSSKFLVEVVYEGLDLPASLEFAPDGSLMILERGFAFENAAREPAITVLDVSRRVLQTLAGRIPGTSHFDTVSGNQGGAVGLALDPQYSVNRKLYVCYHRSASDGGLENRLSSFEARGGRLEHETVIVDHLPADLVHNGCRVAIDDKGLLYLTTGSLEPFDDALDLTRLSGKILRITRTGAVPLGNPFPDSPVWSYGHRNPQGLAFDRATGVLWSTEHGESSADELNRIEPGANYGWPACRGSAAIGETFRAEPYWSDRLALTAGRATCRLPEPHASRYRPAFRTYDDDDTVGISDLVVYRGDAFPDWRGSLLVTMLKAQRLVRVDVKDVTFDREETLLDSTHGRLRDVTVGPDGFVYVLTNETRQQETWRGHSRLLRLRPPPH